MKKLIILGIFALALTTVFTLKLHPAANAAPNHSATFVTGQITYVADGQVKAMDVTPFIENNRAYVPVRYLCNALGVQDAEISWDQASGSITVIHEGSSIKMAVGSASLLVNDREENMDVTPLLKEDRVFLPARWVAEAMGYEVKWDEAGMAVLVAPPGSLPEPGTVTPLPTVGTYENLKDLLAKTQAQRMVGSYPLRAAENTQKIMYDKAAGNAEADAAPDYSRTNVQVEGVDEADIVKTDGEYIYQVNRERIVIAKAYPATDMEIVSNLNFERKNFLPQEIYVDGKHMVVIGSTDWSRDYPIYRENLGANPSQMPYPYQQEMVKAIVYNIEDKTNIKEQRELELNGSYVSSRKIGQSFYLVANKHIRYYPLQEIEAPKPIYRDTAIKDGLLEINYPDIKCFPDFTEPNYLIVAGLNLDRPDEGASVSSYLGAGQNAYASTKNLYIAVTGYKHTRRAGGPVPLIEIWPPVNRDETKIYKFSMGDGRLTYTAGGTAPGSILNQFSMDEHNDYFRIATTQGDVWRTGEATSKNNVYVLDSSLNTVGKIEGIAPGEKIYSVRFVGDRGYMVTFKTVDPFFVLDLKDPYRPEILGALKIPGYSDYLHPYDENHIIGFGKDTVEISRKGQVDAGAETMAFYQGMKMAIFDVSDVSNPVEMFRETIGDRGTDSDLLHNHKALLFSKDKNLLAFPVKVMEVKGGDKPGTSVPEYGSFAFQGAYVYNIDLTEGFTLKGKITHLSREDYLKAGNYWYDSDKNVKRILYIGDVLYTLSNNFIKANSLAGCMD